MDNSSAGIKLATGLLLTRLLPLTAGTCLLLSASPSEARGGDDIPRVMRGGRAQQTGFSRRDIPTPVVPNGFTPEFNREIPRHTTGVETRRFDLDLSSATRNIQLGTKLFDGIQNVTINVNGLNQTFSAGDQVTAAQYVAIQQMLSQNQQLIEVNAQGTASGGSFNLSQPNGTRINNLVVPQNVSAVNNFSSNRSINLSGDLTNMGSIYGLSTSNRVRSGVISADDINNSGIISTNIDDTFLASQKGLVRQVDLTLVSNNDLINSGTISSSGALNVATVSGTMTNSGSMSAARGDLNVFTGGTLNNSGSIAALNGDLNISTSTVATDLNINGAGGTFSALRGDINVRGVEYADANDTTMLDGTYLTKNLNVNGGGGTITAYVDEIDGELNTSGLAAHVSTDAGTLVLGSNCLTGDPTFANAAGDILINGPVIAREDITILAAGNIIATGNAYISTANSTGQTNTPSTNITLVAGATIVLAGGATSTTGVPNPGGAIPTGSTASVDFATPGLGGNIDFSASKYLGYLIDTSSNLNGGNNQQDNGGNVTLAAYSTNSSNGIIRFPEARLAINTSSVFANSGNVDIIAGNTATSTKSPSIRLGVINTQADVVQGNNSGSVNIYAAQPESTTGAPIVFDSTGAIQGAVNFETNPLNLTFNSGLIQFTGDIRVGDANIRAITGGTGGLIQKGTGRIQGEVVTLTAGLGGIGSGSSKKAARLFTEADVLLMNSGSNIFIDNLGTVNIGNAGAPGATAGDLGIVDILTTADGEGDGAIAIPNNGIIQASTGTLSVINLTSSSARAGNGNITTANTALLVATTVNLATINEADGIRGLGFGNIGTNSGAQSINVDADFISANTQGNVFIHSDTGAVTILDSSAGNGATFDVRTTPDGAGDGFITIGGTIASEFGRIGTLLLASSENGAGVGGIIPGGTLVADAITLRDDNAAGNAGLGTASLGTLENPIIVNTSELEVRTLGTDIVIENIIKTGMELSQVNTNADRSGNFVLTSASTVNITGDVFVINDVSITASGKGHIIVNSDIETNNAASDVFLTTGSGSITGGSTIFNTSGTGLTVTLTTAGGAIGTEGIPLSIEADTLFSNGTGFTSINNETNTTLTVASVLSKNKFTLVSDGAIIAPAILTPTSIKLATTGNAGITLTDFVGNGKGTSFVEIITGGTGDITQAGNALISAKVLISLSTGGGDIGSSPVTGINVSAPGLSANVDGGGGVVFLNAVSPKKVPLTLFNSSADGDFGLNSTGSVLLNNIQTVNGSISVQATTGTVSTNVNSIIQVAENAAPTTGAESILLQTFGTKKSGITIGQNSTIAAYSGGKAGVGAGDIIIAVGVLGTPVAGPNPGNVTINTTGSGEVFFGTNGITAAAPNNTLNAIDADIIFSTGTLSASAIVLGGGVTITADPPATTPVTTIAATAPVEINGAGLAPRTIPTIATTSSLNASANLETSNNSNPGASLPAMQSLNDFSNFATAFANAESALSFASAIQAATIQPGWISETELVNGEIPATVHGAEIVGIPSDDTATIFDGTASSAENNSALGGTSTARFSKVSDVKTLSRGTVVFAPSKDILVNTPVGSIAIGARSLALVMAFQDGVAVYDLDDVQKGAIEISVAGKSIALSPGQHVFVARDSVRSFEDVNPAQIIGYRGLSTQNIAPGFKTFSGEFCVPHAIHAVKPLKHLLNSNHPKSKKVADHLIKTTAAIMQLRGNAGAYQQVFRPRKTAWAN